MRIVHSAIVIIAVLMLAAALWCTVNLTSRRSASSMRGASEPAASAITTYPKRLHQPLIHRTRQDSDPYQTTQHHQEEEEDTDLEDFLEDHNFDRRIGRNIRSVSSYNDDMRLARRSHPGSLRAIQKYLRETNQPLDCCPSVEQLTEPEGAKDLDGMYVKLYRDGNITQRFFENSCQADVVNKPCKFVHTKLAAQSLCVQKYIYVYAIVQDHEIGTTRSRASMSRESDRRADRQRRNMPGIGLEEYKKHQFHSLPGPSNGSGWRLDYIMVHSGCSCEIKKKKTQEKRTSRHNYD